MATNRDSQTTRMKERIWLPRRLLSDWQMPDFLEKLEIDVEYFADKLEDVGAQVVQFTAKNSFGNSLYPTKIGRQHPTVVGGRDLFGEICSAVKRRGIGIIGYFNVLLDYDTAGEREQWLQRDVDGNALSFEQYPMFCMSSPYIDTIVPHIAEMAEWYDIDGVMLDIQYWNAKGCFCKHCASGFKEYSGYGLDPKHYDNRQWMEFARFQRDVKRNAILRIKAAVDDVRSDLEWTWNGSGNMSTEYELDTHLGSYGTEAHPPAYDSCSAKSKWMHSSGKPFELWMPESIGSWGHHTITTAVTLKGMSAIALANGGAVTINHSVTPSGAYGGKVADGVYDTIDNVFEWISEREAACDDVVSEAEIAVLHSEYNTLYERITQKAGRVASPSTPRSWLVGQGATYAIAGVLDSIQAPFDMLHSECALVADKNEAKTRNDGYGYPRNLDEYACLILPNVGIMNTVTADAIRSYVDRGGCTISTYMTSLLDENGVFRDNFLLADLFGVDFDSFSEYTIGYLDRIHPPFDRSLPRLPLLFKDTGYQTTSNNPPILCRLRDDTATPTSAPASASASASAYASITNPIIEADWSKQYHIFHDHAPPGELTTFPGVVMNRYGKGTSIYLPVPLLESYVHLPNPWYRALIRNALHAIGVPSRISFSGPSSLRVVVNRAEDELLVHLIRIQQETGGILLEEEGTIEATCILPRSHPVESVRNKVTGESVAWEADENGSVRFAVSVGCHEIIAIS